MTAESPQNRRQQPACSVRRGTASGPPGSGKDAETALLGVEFEVNCPSPIQDLAEVEVMVGDVPPVHQDVIDYDSTRQTCKQLLQLEAWVRIPLLTPCKGN